MFIYLLILLLHNVLNYKHFNIQLQIQITYRKRLFAAPWCTNEKVA